MVDVRLWTFDEGEGLSARGKTPALCHAKDWAAVESNAEAWAAHQNRSYSPIIGTSV